MSTATPDRIERETTIDAPIDRVWSVLTEAEHLGTWFGDSGATIDLRPGGPVTFTWEEYGTANGVVETVDPPNTFAFRWLMVPNPVGAGGEPTAENSTLVKFTLAEDTDGATRLKVVETGFAGLALANDAARTQRYEGNRDGWKVELGHLKEHAERVASAGAR